MCISLWTKFSWTVLLVWAGLTQMPTVGFWVSLGLPDLDCHSWHAFHLLLVVSYLPVGWPGMFIW